MKLTVDYDGFHLLKRRMIILIEIIDPCFNIATHVHIKQVDVCDVVVFGAIK